MSIRWRILILLFLIRSIMAFQFATIGAIAPVMSESYGLSSAQIGALIGFYFLPGIFIALPGGAISSWIGDKRILLFGLVLMAFGATIMVFADNWTWLVVGRISGGIGGVLLNLLLSKAIMDWFAGHEISTAMGIFVNSWPAGIGMALLIQPSLVDYGGTQLVFLTEAIITGVGIVGFLLFYRKPENASQGVQAANNFPMGAMLIALICAALVWGLMNAGLGVALSFGPTILSEMGRALTAASASTSIIIWCVALTGVFGGIIADKTGKPILQLTIALTLFGGLLFIFPRSEGTILILAAMGLACGLTVGPIMSLPARILTAKYRATGMGLFFTIYYICFALAPWIAGVSIEQTGWTGSAFDIGAAMIGISIIAGLLAKVFWEKSENTFKYRS